MSFDHAVQTAKHVLLFIVPSAAVTVADGVASSAMQGQPMSRAVEESLLAKNYCAAASYVVGAIVGIAVARYKIRKNQRKSKGD